MILEVINVTKRFGGLTAVDNVSFKVEPTEVLGIIGPNGSGKTTLFNLMTGFLRPDKGSIIFNGTNIVGKKPHQIANMGMIKTWQLVKPFLRMSVLDNVLVALYVRNGIIKGEDEYRLVGRATEILELVGLNHRKYATAEILPQGEKKRLELARALATEPRVLMLDEPTGGLTTTETNEIIRVVEKIKESKITVILIEHNMKFIMDVCDRIIALNYGKKIAEGSPEQVSKNSEVLKAYLGEKFYVGS
jgi:branched-chain amino acid transport system ATP-binding protein